MFVGFVAIVVTWLRVTERTNRGSLIFKVILPDTIFVSIFDDLFGLAVFFGTG